MRVEIDSSDLFRTSPEDACGTGVVVLSGSSGRLERDRAQLFARHGADALALRWFGGVGQRPGPCEVPLETFFGALDRLAGHCDRLAVVAASFGAEAALLTAVHDRRVDAVIALAPTPVAWAGFGGDHWSSHWTLDGVPVPYVAFVEGWEPTEDPPAYRELYEASLVADPVRAEEATIRSERIQGEVVLIAGGDDQVWPSVQFARLIAERRGRHALATTVVTDPEAGHRIRFPGEPSVDGGQQMARGGTPRADAALGQAAWPHVAAALRLH
jgi:dienelactone hydrolase